MASKDEKDPIKIILWGFGLLSTILCTIFGFQYQSQEKMTDTVSNMDRKITAYISGNIERQQHILLMLDDHEDRLRYIERTTK